MGWFRKREPAEPLAVSITGVKLGDRLLAVGVRDPRLVATLARKTGLTGHVAAADADADRVARATAIIQNEGALADVVQAPWGALPFGDASFDVAVICDLLMTMAADVRARCLADVLRVLRPGGRVIVIEPAPRGGIGALLTRNAADPHYTEQGGAAAALKAEGFGAVRTIAERDGVSYVEGVKSGGVSRH
jgi:ubiquinone/menaquinone biosynthesis C-methylase UbiE